MRVVSRIFLPAHSIEFMTNSNSSSDVHAVYAREGDTWLPTELSRGPWDPRAQHGGAPCALLAHVAESAVLPENGWRLARMTVELVKPVPVAPLRTQHVVQAARSTARVTIDLFADAAGRACPCAAASRR